MSEEKPMDLEQFVINHKELLTAMGVFAGLSALFSRLEMQVFGSLLAAICFAVVLVLCWELLTKPPIAFYTNDRLTFFKSMIVLLVIFLMFYLGVVYTTWSAIIGLMFMVFFGGAILAVTVTSYARFSSKHKTSGKIIELAGKGTLIAGFGFAMLIIILMVVFLILYLLGVPLPTPSA